MKKKLLAVIMSALCLTAAMPQMTVLADGQKVVTLGADLSEDQKQAILRYFGVAGQNLQTLTITNQDERNHLGSFIPIEQIGTRTYSCALVSPTNSGGIQVKTANLSFVTSNMIASTLSTSGVVNCDVLAAAPFEVSGTGALTGILMAYESAVGETLDTEKKETATQELVTTTTIANNIGQVQATEIVNESKMQVIQGDVVKDNDIDIIINEVAEKENISLTDEDRALLSELLQQIAKQDYDYDEMKETLERVESNMETLANQQQTENTADTAQQTETSAQTEAPAQTETAGQTETPETLAEDSILMNTDDSALGGSVIFDATDDSALTETEAPAQSETQAQQDSGDFTITTSDETVLDNQGETSAETNAGDVSTEAPVETNAGDVSTEAPAETNAGDVSTEAPAETNAGDVSADGMTETIDDAAATSNLEIIPLSDFVFSPMSSESTGYEVFPAGMNKLEISFQRDDIAAGNGTLSIYNAADSLIIETVNMNDATKVVIEPLSDEELEGLGWTSGSKAVVYLDNQLAPSSSYFVTLSQDAFIISDGIGSSEATPDNYSWMIETGEYGFGLDETAAGVTAGSQVEGSIMMDGTGASYAAIENYDSSLVTFDQTEFWATGKLNATFAQTGIISFQVNFYDEAGTVLYTIGYTVNVK